MDQQEGRGPRPCGPGSGGPGREGFRPPLAEATGGDRMLGCWPFRDPRPGRDRRTWRYRAYGVLLAGFGLVGLWADLTMLAVAADPRESDAAIRPAGGSLVI